MPMSHNRHEDIGNFRIRDLEMAPKVLQDQRSWCTFRPINWAMVNFVCLGATVHARTSAKVTVHFRGD